MPSTHLLSRSWRHRVARRRTHGLAAAGLAAGLCLGTAHAQFGVAVDGLGQTVVPIQITRPFPVQALRGELRLITPPEAQLNGQAARLAPAARIWGPEGRLVAWSEVLDQKLRVNYTVDSLGLLMDVWILRPDEWRQRWPRSAEEAAALTYDPISRVWLKP